MTTTSRLFAEYAILPEGLVRDVHFEIADGRFLSVHGAGTPPNEGLPAAVSFDPATETRLSGVVLPGFANTHSHAFHRALRGRTHDDGGTFWTWRERMYAVAAKLDPDAYYALARATYAEMALAGIASVGEFHYLHHGPGGVRYGDPNLMAEALRSAASEAGIRLTLLDTAYLTGGLGPTGHLKLNEVQQRFSDGDVAAWVNRVDSLKPSESMRIGAAIHSVRAVPRAAVGDIARRAQRSGASMPLHVHLSEQPAENEACLAFYGCTPTQLLDSEQALGDYTTVVHATHLTDSDIRTLGTSRTTACFCPTTERDLADGIGPARALRDAGTPVSLGSDQHVVIDSFEEARGLESHERLASLERGRFSLSELMIALTAHASIGWPDAGRLQAGYRADLVSVRLDSPRTAGSRPEQVLMSATAADIDSVIVDGRLVVSAGTHLLVDVGARLQEAITPIWGAL
ncbi:formimidoylglutamate deiminase [Jatrophihabitans sp. DSM 45814]